jgi:AAHS family benzoate transporter-like MFS transporter
MSSTASPARANRMAFLAVGLCWLVVFFDGLDMFIYGAVLPHMLEHKALGIDGALAGDLGSYATFGMLVGALCSGTVTDWIGRKKVVVASTALFSLASALCAVAPSVGVFGLGRFLAGVGLGGLLPTALTLVAEYAPRGRRALVVGTLMTAHQAGGILAGFVGMWTGGENGWRTAFWICVLPLVVGVPAVVKYLPESTSFLIAKGRGDQARQLAARYDVDLPVARTDKPADGSRWAALAGLFKGGLWTSTLLYWLASFGGLVLVYGVSNWLPSMMRGAGYDLGPALAFMVVINVGGIVGHLAAGRLSDRFDAPRIVTLWFLITSVTVFLLGVHMPLPLTYVVVFLAGAFLFSAQSMLYAAVAAGSGDANRATAMGWTTGMGRFGAVLGPWIGGQLAAAHNEHLGFTVFAVAGFASMVFMLLSQAPGLRAPRKAVDGPPAATEPLSA